MGRTRTSHRHWAAGIFIVILIAFIFFVPSYGWKIRMWLSPVAGGVTAQDLQADDQSLAAENDALKAQIAELQVVSSELPTSTPNEIRAMVYSRYPMNFRNELLVNAGGDEGVVSGAAVIFQGMLIGQVRTVFPEESLVQTIFDDDFKLPVRIGVTGASGLFQGGAYPTIGSIASAATIAPDDIVYSAAPGIPYALSIGTIATTSTSPDSLFQEATLDFPYDVNDIQTVFIAP